MGNRKRRTTYQPGPVRPVSFVLPVELRDLLFEAAHRERITMSGFVRAAIAERATKILAERPA